MDRTAIEGKLIAVPRQIRADSGLECLLLTGATKPVGDMGQFYNGACPFATTILATTKRKSPVPRSLHPARSADNISTLQLQYTRRQVRHPGRRQDDDLQVVGNQTQAPALFLGRPADPTVARRPVDASGCQPIGTPCIRNRSARLLPLPA